MSYDMRYALCALPPHSTLDWILCSLPAHCRVVGAFAKKVRGGLGSQVPVSDHLPVVAIFEIGSAPLS
jgi:hypothetical protein